MRNVYFISGHRNLTEKEFKDNYREPITNAAYEDRSTFVIGDCYGADIMAQNFLLEVLKVNPDRITVYCASHTPRLVNPRITKIKSGYKTYTERDAAMTADSTVDIAIVRDPLKKSGTGANILRRYQLKQS